MITGQVMDPTHAALPGAGANRYSFRGPGINNWDLTFFKNIPVKEKLTFQFNWEMYNSFNHTPGLATRALSRYLCA